MLIYDLYKCGRYDFGVPTLLSDSSHYMGAAAKAYYRLTKKRTAFGYVPFEKYLNNRKNPSVQTAAFGENEAAVYLASGGTTGEPKIIAHNNRVFNTLCAKAEEFLSEPIQMYRALYNVLPIFHGFGLCINMHMCMLMRRTNIMCIQFSPKMSAKQIVKGKANILTGVPTMFLKLLGEKAFVNADLSNIKDVYVGGDSVPQQLIVDFNAALERGGRFDGNGYRLPREHACPSPRKFHRIPAFEYGRENYERRRGAPRGGGGRNLFGYRPVYDRISERRIFAV